uniref:Adenylate cyclase type 3 n=1 Tax=Callithrix jacchus TaxID=9483 RepID=A0A8I4A2A4_CALJA
MPRNQGFSEPEYSAEYSAEYSVSLPSDPDRGVGRTHEISVRNSGSCLCLPRFMRLTFVPESLENLYQTYFKRQRHETLLVLVVFAALFDCYVVVMCAVVFSSNKLAPLAVAGIGLVLDIVLFVLCKKGLLPDRVTRRVVPYLLWLLITAQIFSYLGLNFVGAHAASDTVGWQVFFVFSFFITLPLSLSPIVIISVVSCVLHMLVLGVTVAQQQQEELKEMQLLREILANVFLYLCAITVGIMSYYMADRKHRKAFLEARQSLEVKMNLEEQSQQQENLMLSILPKHVADEMLKDMKKDESQKDQQQFNTMYMYRHENVRYVREKTKTGVDMRVGVHTGTVLGGVLGQKRWQYDVWSTDVTVANKMEAGGIPGRVHISQSTMDCLKGEFDVEPGDGGSRCEYLDEKGIETYLVIASKPEVKKTATQNGLNGSALPNGAPASSKPSSPALIETKEPNGSTHSSGSMSEKPEEQDAQADNPSFPNPRRRLRLQDLADRVVDASEDEHELNQLLNEALLERESAQVVKKRNTFLLSMRFMDPEMETRYSVEKEKQSGAAFSCSCVVLLCTALVEILIDPWLMTNYVTFVVGEILLLILTICSLAAIFPRAFPKKLVGFSTWIDRTRWARNTWAMLAIFILVMANVVDMLSCLQYYAGPSNTTAGMETEGRCLENPKYYNYVAVLSLIATIMLVQVSHMVKLTLMLLVAGAVAAINLYAWRPIFDEYDRKRFREYDLPMVALEKMQGFTPGLNGTDSLPLMPSKYSMTVMVFLMMLSFYYFSRHVEKLARTLFLWKIEVHDQKERVYEMRRWNEALVTNMLPEHVARHFLGSKKRDEELYSQTYDEIGVMFASLPNFADFYTEESINNGGIECLRFLNEIISDFDSLLDNPKFRVITKIKTIGSTYMAASGVTPDVNTNGYASSNKEDKSDRERWQHLADLADFALAMKDTLTNINNQSFNNFMLRIGMNKGGVLAGVIGARKPHYDIWGNTVNVASRMESTGVMGNIQVVEETQVILREYGFRFVRRGPIFVKGKGELLTFFLKGREKPTTFPNGPPITLPHQVEDSS